MFLHSLIFGIINWSLALISIIIFVFIFLIFIEIIHEERSNDPSTLLILNTCFSAFLTSLTVVIMIGSNLFHEFLLIDLNICYICGLLYDTFECSIYYSYCLHAFYRLIRVIYYNRRNFLSYNLYKLLILIQWLLTISLILPTYFFKWYIHLPTEKYCLIPYTNIIGSIYLILFLYSIPLLTIIMIYVLITNHIRSPTIIRIQERQRNLRDLTVIKRIIVCVLMLVILRFPTIIFIIFGLITDHLYYLTYPIVGFVTAICLILIGILTILATNKIKKNLLKHLNHPTTQIHPTHN
ncbi:unnamed protein product [Adineta steineri]|uniref:G-protein coupled receptors family 1 profile domain-containing protein n=1 Tax=Adineta steineri TaxID=433720 RepID=A0A813T4K0_9BILA|nr:unnamed protein product [Adineta steineri]CAF3524229.1 unnamed protein product [Adineta steineri]